MLFVFTIRYCRRYKIISIPDIARIRNILLPDNFYQLLFAAALPRVYKYAFCASCRSCITGECDEINYIKLSCGRVVLRFI